MKSTLTDWCLFGAYSLLSLVLHVICFRFIISMWQERRKKAISMRMPQMVAFNFYWASICLFNSWLNLYIRLGLTNRTLDVISLGITNFWVLYTSLTITCVMWRHVWYHYLCKFETEQTWKSELRMTVSRPWVCMFSPFLQLWQSVVTTCSILSLIISVIIYVTIYFQIKSTDHRVNAARIAHNVISILALLSIIQTVRLMPSMMSVGDCYGIKQEMYSYIVGTVIWMIFDLSSGICLSSNGYIFRLLGHLKNSLLITGYFYVTCYLSVQASKTIRHMRKRKVVIRSNNNMEMRLKSSVLLKKVLQSYESFSMFTEHCVQEMNVEGVLFIVWYMRAKQLLFLFLKDNDMFDYDNCKDFLLSVQGGGIGGGGQRASGVPSHHSSIVSGGGGGYTAGDDDTSSESLGFHRPSYYQSIKNAKTNRAFSPQSGLIGGVSGLLRSRVSSANNENLDTMSDPLPYSPDDYVLLQDIAGPDANGKPDSSPSKTEFSMSSLSSRMNKMMKRKPTPRGISNKKRLTVMSRHKVSRSEEGINMIKISRGHKKRYKLFHGDGKLTLNSGGRVMINNNSSDTLALPPVFQVDSSEPLSASLVTDDPSPVHTVRSIDQVKLDSTTTKVLLKPAALTIETQLTNPIMGSLKLGVSSNSTRSDRSTDDDDDCERESERSGRDVEDFTLGLDDQSAIQSRAKGDSISPPILLHNGGDTYDSSGPNDLVIVCENEELEMSDTTDQMIRHNPSLIITSDGGTSTEDTSTVIPTVDTPPPDPASSELVLGTITSERKQPSKDDFTESKTADMKKRLKKKHTSLTAESSEKKRTNSPEDGPRKPILKSCSANDIESLKDGSKSQASRKPGLWTLLESMRLQNDGRSKLRDSPSPPMAGLLFSTTQSVDQKPRRRYCSEIGTIIRLPPILFKTEGIIYAQRKSETIKSDLTNHHQSSVVTSTNGGSNGGTVNCIRLEYVASRLLNILNDFIAMDGLNCVNVSNDCRSNAMAYRQRLKAIGGDLSGDPIFKTIAQSMSLDKKVKVILRCLVCLDTVLSDVMRMLQNDSFQRFIETNHFHSWASSKDGPFSHRRKTPTLVKNVSM